MKPHLQHLNPAQREAVQTTEGPLLVLAGAGTGKTRVITCRIAQLLAQGVPAEAILAMTFTNKAARQMGERVGRLVGPERAGALTVGTFHAFCLNLLRHHRRAAGWPRGFTICDSADQLSLLRGVLRELHVGAAKLRPGDLAASISLAKSRLETPESHMRRGGDDRAELVGRAWLRYQEALRRSLRLDFDDLLLETLRLLDEKPAVRKTCLERYRYLLVDEYQDTNTPQFEILRRLAGERGNLCVVGDDDQSIYGWRGADLRNILSFEQHFPGARVVRLETNYRSTGAILAVAGRLIAHNSSRHVKSLHSVLGPGEPPRAVCMRDEEAEAEQVVAEIVEHVRHGAHHDEFALLLRTATQARPFETELRARGVPYVMVGGMSFFDRKEVRDVLAYLRLVANPRDETSLLRVVNRPPRGVGAATLERALDFATEHAITLTEAFERGAEIEGIAEGTVGKVLSLLGRLEALGRKHSRGGQLVALVQRLLEEVAYRDEVTRCHPDPAEAERRWAGVLEVANFAENHVRRAPRPGLMAFLNELTLTGEDRQETENGERRLAVTLSTLHAAKGLEFERVYLVGLEEGLLPHRRSAAEDGVEEERRLAYVGVTRARKQLTLSWCRERARAGMRLTGHPSRFLLEIQDREPPEGWVPAEAQGREGAGGKGRGKGKGRRKPRGRRRGPARP